MSKPIRVLIAKPGFDGHEAGARLIARSLRDAGMEVVYLGTRQTPEMIVNAALQEDVDIIGLSILSGIHKEASISVFGLLKEKGAQDISVIVGGIIPHDDSAELKRLGVKGVFGPGTNTNEVVRFIQGLTKFPAG
jgi:methylmalonyl-CoA mutase C-terminal domain/subunit